MDKTGKQYVAEFVKVSRSGGYPTFRWLWQPLGVSRVEFDRGETSKFPIIQEIVSAVSALRFKRSRKGCSWTSPQGRALASVLEIQVRGRTLKVANDLKALRLGLREKEDMKWFLKIWIALSAGLSL